MLNIASILFSSIMMLAVIVRALALDRTDPWFPTLKNSEKPAERPGRAWARRR